MHNNAVARIDWGDYNELAPDAVTALRALGKAVDDSGLDKQLTELLKIRASQLNGCAFCLQFHLNVARNEGVPPTKIDLVATWADTDIFTARERAALAWTEALTKMGQQHIAGNVYDELYAHFTSSEVAHLTASIAAINAWNRIAGALRFTPPIPTGQSRKEAA
jgi:AhpD family alkylhydroperoxidase